MDRYLDIGLFVILQIFKLPCMKKFTKDLDDEDYLNIRIFCNLTFNLVLFLYWKIFVFVGEQSGLDFALQRMFCGSSGIYIIMVEFFHIFGVTNRFNFRRRGFKYLDMGLSIVTFVITLLQCISEPVIINIILITLSSIDIIFNFIEIVRNAYYTAEIDSPKEKDLTNNFQTFFLGLIIGFILMAYTDLSLILNYFQKTDQLDTFAIYTIVNDSVYLVLIPIPFYLYRRSKQIKNRLRNSGFIESNSKDKKKNKFSKKLLACIYGIYISNFCMFTNCLAVLFGGFCLYFHSGKYHAPRAKEQQVPIQQTII